MSPGHIRHAPVCGLAQVSQLSFGIHARPRGVNRGSVKPPRGPQSPRKWWVWPGPTPPMNQTLPKQLAQQAAPGGPLDLLSSQPALAPPDVPTTAVVSCTHSEPEDQLTLGPPARFRCPQPHPTVSSQRTVNAPPWLLVCFHVFIQQTFTELLQMSGPCAACFLLHLPP